MKQHVNFYENLKEAMMRLQYTVVMYDNEPYLVLTICEGASDGVFRVYMDKLGNPEGMAHHRLSVPYEWYDEPGEPTRMSRMDEFLRKNPDCGVIRKMMNSPKFNRFRPFPLGMCNAPTLKEDQPAFEARYIERGPSRHTQQGLTDSMLFASGFHFGSSSGKDRTVAPSVTTPQMYDCIKGVYPSASDCLLNLTDPDVLNDSAAFDRNFALVRGPVDIMFLAYKQDIIGTLPNGDFSSVVISKDFKHTKEVVEGLNLFNDIRTR